MGNTTLIKFKLTDGLEYTYFFNDVLDELLKRLEFEESNGFLKSSNGTYLMIKHIVSFQVINSDGDVAQ